MMTTTTTPACVNQSGGFRALATSSPNRLLWTLRRAMPPGNHLRALKWLEDAVGAYVGRAKRAFPPPTDRPTHPPGGHRVRDHRPVVGLAVHGLCVGRLRLRLALALVVVRTLALALVRTLALVLLRLAPQPRRLLRLLVVEALPKQRVDLSAAQPLKCPLVLPPYLVGVVVRVHSGRDLDLAQQVERRVGRLVRTVLYIVLRALLSPDY